ncbi:unnamed protein product [Brachionus calyciflorus]|uniref:Uncharacterized protein n=1 Tax=Brachionus calyciflorus TaxID=104777 RepID=A0A813M3C9_9BILA|nr:unnamed protein product [Brachionus calyciflorus]
MFDSLIKKFSTQRQIDEYSTTTTTDNQYSMIELESLKQLDNLKIHHMEEHIYEEIEDANNNNLNHYYSSLDYGGKHRKCVRFNSGNEPIKTNSLTTSILKKPGLDSNDSELSSSSNSSCSFVSGYYTNNSISSSNSTNSNSSSHSLIFQQLVDDFINRLPARDQCENKKKSNSNCNKLKTKKELIKSNSLNSQKNEFKELKDQRLSFRVTNLTLDDLKNRQKLIYLNSMSSSSNKITNCDSKFVLTTTNNNNNNNNSMPIQI